MDGPNARPCKHTDERVTCAPTEAAEPGLRRPCVFRRGLATYPHPPKMPATGSDRNGADPTRSSTALDTGARDRSDNPLGYGTYASGETSHDAQLDSRPPAVDRRRGRGRLGATERFPRRLIAERRSRFVKLGTHVRIPEAALDELIVASTVN
jgi:excisionase family DNA binding protein